MENLRVTAASTDYRSAPSPMVVPWLVFSHGENNQAFYNLLEPNSESYPKSIPEIQCKIFWHSPSHRGWLIILSVSHINALADNDHEHSGSSNGKFEDCFLWNPVLSETIHLPALPHWLQSNKYYVVDSVLSSPPGTLDDAMVCFLVADVDNEDTPYFLVLCHPGDKEWKIQELSGIDTEKPLSSLICFKGKLYVMGMNDFNLEIQCLGIAHDVEPFSIKSFDINTEALCQFRGEVSEVHSFYVESSDELFRVDISNDQPPSINKEYQIQVLRMNFNLMAWEDVKNMGDHVLFLGRRTTWSCSATDLSLATGCIYFTMPEDKNLYTFYPEGSIYVSLPCPHLATPWFSPDWILMPTTVRAIDGQGRTDDKLFENREETITTNAKENNTKINMYIEKEAAQKNNEGELEAGIWSNFDEHILGFIATHLHSVPDYMHFRAVCKEHRSAITAGSWNSSKIMQTIFSSPLLVYAKRDDAIYSFIDPMHNNEKYFMNLSQFLLDSIIYSSKGGWLLMGKSKKAPFFFNPFTKVTIQLPELPEHYCHYLFSSMSFSSLPTASDCIVFTVMECSINHVRIFCLERGKGFWYFRLFENTELPLMENCIEFIPCVNNTISINDVFFCMDYKGTLGIFYLYGTWHWRVLSKPIQLHESIYRSFLVECEGKLLTVFLWHFGTWLRIFRLDWSLTVWVEVKTLGKHTLFLSSSSCLSAIAPTSQMENKIYFHKMHGERIIYYSLDTGMYHSIGTQHSSNDFYDTTEMLDCGWIQPNLSETSDGELDWLNSEVNTSKVRLRLA